jgi:hypothetical protein
MIVFFNFAGVGSNELDATEVATVLIRRASGMLKTQPLRGKVLLSLFQNDSFTRYSYLESVAIPN